ncbi:MAG: RimK family alpha-L-glutamate ligase [Chitinophagales bacterium]
MKQFDIVLLTQEKYVFPEELSEYNKNILIEDALLRAALEENNLRVIRKSWDDRNFNWEEAKYIVLRTPWDYFHRFDEFFSWLETTSQVSEFINPLETIKWNIDKHYILDLASKNIPIVPTIIIEPGTATTLAQEFEKAGYKEIIIKPAISGTARHTYRITETSIEIHEKIFRELVLKESMLIQPFLESILTKGEITLVVLGGRFSHAVLKKAKQGDFRVQDDFGGTVHYYDASKTEIELAEQIMQSVSPLPLYGRVDLVWDENDDLVVSELELIEPELWMRFKPSSAKVLAEKIYQKYFNPE